MYNQQSTVFAHIDDLAHSEDVCPEKRLLANVLQRAIIDFLGMEDKEGRIVEVLSGKYNKSDDSAYTETYKVQTVGRDNEKERRDRNLVRWFNSMSKHPFSFLYILEVLNISWIKYPLLDILRKDTIRSYPGLQLAQI